MDMRSPVHEALHRPLSTFNRIPPAFITSNEQTMLSVQFPFILLGQKGINEELDVVGQAFRDFSPEIRIITWTDREFNKEGKEPQEVENEETRGEFEEIKAERAAWKLEESKRWKDYQNSGLWILRHTPSAAKSSHGIIGSPKDGDGILTEEERTLMGESIWSLPFTLQRFYMPLDGRRDTHAWGGEYHEIMSTFEKLSAFEHPQLGSMLKIVTSSRCHPTVAFHRMDAERGEVVSWDVNAVGNIMILLAAFERELIVLSSAPALLEFWPLSRVLTHLAVAQMKRDKIVMLNKIHDNHYLSAEGKEKTWLKEERAWVNDMEKENEKYEMMKDSLSREWWEQVKEMDVANTVRTLEVGWRRRCVVQFELERDAQEAEQEERGEDGRDSKSEVSNSNSYAESSTSPLSYRPPPPGLPSVHSISLPLLPAKSGLLIAHIALLSQIILFSLEHNIHYISNFIHKFCESRELTDDTPLQTLHKFALRVDVREEHIKAWEEEAQEYWSSDEIYKGEEVASTSDLDNPLPDIDIPADASTVPNPQIATPDTYQNHPTTPDASVEDESEKKDSAFNPLSTYLESRHKGGRKYMAEFIERYESVGGFCIPSRLEVYKLMVQWEMSSDGWERMNAWERDDN